MIQRPIHVLVVDDSKVMRLFLAHLLESDPQLRVIGTVDNGQAALDFIRRKKPDVVLMDIHMPGMDGFESTRLIMQTQPVPIVICSATTDTREVEVTFRLLEAGAVACVNKPTGSKDPESAALTATMIETVKLMSEIKVVKRWARSRSASASPPPVVAELKPLPTAIKFIGMGASTGGPPVLHTILAGLPQDFPVPILIVQHIARGFLAGLVDWLGQMTKLRVLIGTHGTRPLPGHVYLAPDDYHMEISASGRIVLVKGEDDGLKPAVSHLFRSLAETCGPAAIGVLLTGMGKDGAVELKLMKEQGALTLAQDRESSVIHGMPGEAIALGAATHVLPADKIADFLVAATVKRRIENFGS